MNNFFTFSEIATNDFPLLKLSKEIPDKEMSISKLDQPVVKEINVLRKISRCPIEGNNGHWEGERGDSKWVPESETIPKSVLTNPNGLSWNEILKKYDIDGIDFKDGNPDFSEVSKGEVKIDDFSESRDSNFSQADEKLAETKECTPEEVASWRKDNGYTWHECKDCQTMQKVPTEVHGNVPHSGGISEIKLISNQNL